MKFCFICPEYPEGPHGGIGTYTQQTAKELSALGHQIRIIGVYPKSYPAPDYEENGNIKIWRLRVGNGKFGWIIPWIYQFRIIKKWVNENDIDLIEAPDSRGWYAFWGKLKVPIILRFHGSQTYIASILKKKPNQLTRLLEKLSYQRADALSSVSEFNAATTANLFNISKPIKVIYNGIKTIQLSNVERDKFHIVFAGTLAEYKGILDFLNALRLLANEEVNFKASIYGKDAKIDSKNASEYINDFSIEPVLQGKITYYGSVKISELMDIYQRATVAVFPSHVESFGLAPVEAMMCECPVIFTNNTTGHEIIEDKRDGVLVSPKKPIEIKEAVQFLLNNPESASEIGKRGRQKAILKFSIQNQVDQSILFYNNCLQQFYNK